MIVVVLVLVAHLNGSDVPIYTGAVFDTLAHCQKYVEASKTLVPIPSGNHAECRASTLKTFVPH